MELSRPGCAQPLAGRSKGPWAATAGKTIDWLIEHRLTVSSLAASLRLIRPLETAVVVGGTLIGSRLAGSDAISAWTVVWLSLSNGLLFAASMAINDWHDAPEDSINKPDRPVPSGDIPRELALWLGAGLFVAAAVTAALVGVNPGIGAVTVALSSVAYTLRLKGVPVVGNLTVALLSAYPLWCWVLVTPGLSRVHLTLTVACFLFRFGAEVLKTAEDFVGDRAAGIRTVATVVGAGRANRLGTSILCLALLACWSLAAEAPLVYGLSLAVSSSVALYSLARAFLRPSDIELSRSLVTHERAIMVVMVLGFGLSAARL